jgi:hypothetical protein
VVVEAVARVRIVRSRVDEMLRASDRNWSASPARICCGARDSTAEDGNSMPMTDAGSAVARSVRSSLSRRASSRARIVGGTTRSTPASAPLVQPSAPTAPLSTSIDSICST